MRNVCNEYINACPMSAAIATSGIDDGATCAAMCSNDVQHVQQVQQVQRMQHVQHV